MNKCNYNSNKRLRILALSYLFPNHSWPNFGIFVYNRLRAVQEFCDLIVVAPIPWFPGMQKIKRYQGLHKVPRRDVFGDLAVEYPRFPIIPRFCKILDPFSYLLAVLNVVRKLKKEKTSDFDLIDVHWVYPDILAGYILSKLYNKPFIITVRGKEALHLNEKSLRRLMLNIIIKKANQVVCLSSELKEICSQIGVKRDRISIVLNGIDDEKFIIKDKYKTRNILKLDYNAKIILSVGSLILRKGYLELFRAIANYNQLNNLQVYVVGSASAEGDDFQVLQSELKKLGIEIVHFVGSRPQSELPQWFNAADLFCLFSHSEGCPNVVMEALACGLPIVATRVGAIPDMVQEGRDGYLVSGYDLDEMSKMLDLCLKRKWNRSVIAKAHQKRTWRDCAADVFKIYNSILDKNNFNSPLLKRRNQIRSSSF
jgi:glycosyltransferase involved in cell wall biosynthesis